MDDAKPTAERLFDIYELRRMILSERSRQMHRDSFQRIKAHFGHNFQLKEVQIESDTSWLYLGELYGMQYFSRGFFSYHFVVTSREGMHWLDSTDNTWKQ